MEALFTLIQKEQANSVLDALSTCLHLQVQLLNASGEPLLFKGDSCAYCGAMAALGWAYTGCQTLQLGAAQKAWELGGSYIYACHTGIYSIAFPLVHHKRLAGSIIVGPFLMEEVENALSDEWLPPKRRGKDGLLMLAERMKGMPVKSPAHVQQVSTLCGFLASRFFSGEYGGMRENREKLHQQSRINEIIQLYKSGGASPSEMTLYEQERSLLASVRSRDMADAKDRLNRMLGYVLFVQGQRMPMIKNRALELTTLLSRVAIESGAYSDSILTLNSEYLSAIQRAETFEEVSHILQEIVEGFMSSITAPPRAQGNRAVLMAAAYIARHYSEPLTIRQLAQEVRLSPTYFSALFSGAMGMGFHDYLTRVRIQAAQDLLTATDYPINQIALTVGYGDQSSFTKAFRRVTGLTPNSFR